MNEFSVDGQHVVVVGAARSGVAAAELLVSRGARVTLTDTREAIDEADRLRRAGVSLELGSHSDDVLASAQLVVLSPGVPSDLRGLDALRRRGVPVIGEVELAWRWLKGRVIAISGTKGKSTTTTLTGQMLQAAGLPVVVGGNIGSALSAQVDASTPETLHVVEVSSFQLETADTFHPWIAVLMNFSADHLDRHGTLDAYGAAKARMFAHQTVDDWAVVNADDAGASALATGSRGRRFDFSRSAQIADGIVVDGGSVVRVRDGQRDPLLPLSSIRLLGPHLVDDVLAAAAVASLVGIETDVMRKTVEAFHGLEHALEPAGEAGGVRFVNDSKATNIEAASRAFESFESGVVAIVGGRFKGGDFRDLRDAAGTRVSAVVAIGEARDLVREAFADRIPVHDAETMRDAVRAAFTAAAPGGVVLLAPACASFDMFKDYAERGRAFKEEVRRLGEEWRTQREQ
ncbi:MAG: UDP-N-acetylmuramoyl-L-alanine--D-glutamate ligase [Acidobacteriota bacterium]|nr:UDP-N-acetylmuramoyl-L-alanine--D-glutamate ligase [Acidobacteriota bacterium]